MNDNLHPVSFSAMQHTGSPASVSSSGAETELQSPLENSDADTKMNDNLHSASSSAMQHTGSPASISSSGAETDHESPLDNFNADTKRVCALGQLRLELEDYMRTALQDGKPVTAQQEAIIQEEVNSGMKELERMEMEREAREKEWETKRKAREASNKTWKKQWDEMSEADKVERDRVRAKWEASWKESESRMRVIPPRWNKMKAARRAFWNSMDEGYDQRREGRLNGSVHSAGDTIVELGS